MDCACLAAVAGLSTTVPAITLRGGHTGAPLSKSVPKANVPFTSLPQLKGPFLPLLGHAYTQRVLRHTVQLHASCARCSNICTVPSGG